MSAEVKKELMKLLNTEDVKYLNQAIHNINNLTEYKNAGFTHVGYDDYDDVVAIRHITQSPSERAREIYNTIDSEIDKIKRNEITNEKRLAKIEKLKKQIEKLQEELNNED